MPRPFSHESSLTVALTIVLCAGAFWVGQMAHRLDTVERESQSSTTVLKQLNALTQDLEFRLRRVEER